MHTINKKLTIFLAAVFFFISASAQERKPAAITGMVKDAKTKHPLIEAVVTLSSDTFTGQKFAITDSTGRYTISNLPEGGYTIAFEMEGYQKFVAQNITLKKGMSLGVNYQMMKENKRKKPNALAVADSTFLQVKVQSEQ